jgi:hypothetical protein
VPERRRRGAETLRNQEATESWETYKLLGRWCACEGLPELILEKRVVNLEGRLHP